MRKSFPLRIPILQSKKVLLTLLQPSIFLHNMIRGLGGVLLFRLETSPSSKAFGGSFRLVVFLLVVWPSLLFWVLVISWVCICCSVFFFCMISWYCFLFCCWCLLKCFLFWFCHSMFGVVTPRFCCSYPSDYCQLWCFCLASLVGCSGSLMRYVPHWIVVVAFPDCL